MYEWQAEFAPFYVQVARDYKCTSVFVQPRPKTSVNLLIVKSSDVVRDIYKNFVLSK